MARNKSTAKSPKVHNELDGFEIRINEFGEIKASLNIERLNQFLNSKVDDIKLRGRADVNDALVV